jgi:enamine deaminase RidA (YjgF/YER057c/UK114 family)
MSPQRRGVLTDSGKRPVEGRLGRDVVLPEPLPAFGLYAPAVRTGSLVFLSGAGPVVPTGRSSPAVSGPAPTTCLPPTRAMPPG